MGPCVKLVEKQYYAQQVKLAKLFLDGKNQEIISELVAQMDEASRQLKFERAAEIRDHIRTF